MTRLAASTAPIRPRRSSPWRSQPGTVTEVSTDEGTGRGKTVRPPPGSDQLEADHSPEVAGLPAGHLVTGDTGQAGIVHHSDPGMPVQEGGDPSRVLLMLPHPLPDGDHGLGDPGGPDVTVEQHDVPGLPRRGAGGGPVALWPAGDLQHRPGEPVHERGVHRCAESCRGANLDGSSALPGDRTPMEVYHLGVAA